MIRAGADVVRVNFSHGERASARQRVEMVRAGRRAGRQVRSRMLGDLQGPKIRIERFADGKVHAERRRAVRARLVAGPARRHRIAASAWRTRTCRKDVRAGDTLLLDDGQIVLDVTAVTATRIDTRVVIGGELSDHKGINKQGGGLSAGALTDKDREDIKLAAELGVDYLAVSFARDGADIDEARELLRKRQAATRASGRQDRAQRGASPISIDIMQASDAVMVARGDLGVEVGYAELTGLQKHIIAATRKRNRVVITATQMMESMIHSPVPTRAEVSRRRQRRDGRHRRGDAVGRDRRRQISGEGRARRWREVIIGAEKYESSHSPVRHRIEAARSRRPTKRSRWP